MLGNDTAYLHDIELVVVGGESNKFGSVGHILSRTEKATHYLLVTYALKREKQISIVEWPPLFFVQG